MKPDAMSRDFERDLEQDVGMASSREEAAGAAWEGADLQRPIQGENPESESLDDARRWVGVYSHLVLLEQEMFDVLARMIPNMPAEAQREAEQTNLPVIASQVERFRHRLAYWAGRKSALEQR